MCQAYMASTSSAEPSHQPLSYYFVLFLNLKVFYVSTVFTLFPAPMSSPTSSQIYDSFYNDFVTYTLSFFLSQGHIHTCTHTNLLSPFNVDLTCVWDEHLGLDKALRVLHVEQTDSPSLSSH